MSPKSTSQLSVIPRLCKTMLFCDFPFQFSLILFQLLKRLCQYPASAEELAKEDDLNLLFSAISSWCPTHNIQWRKGAADVLTTISRHGLTEEVVQYVHRKCRCIK